MVNHFKFIVISIQQRGVLFSSFKIYRSTSSLRLYYVKITNKKAMILMSFAMLAISFKIKTIDIDRNSTVIIRKTHSLCQIMYRFSIVMHLR